MSVANLLVPNDYELYINTLHTTNLGVSGVLSVDQINIGNSIGPTGYQPYLSFNTVNYSGLFGATGTPAVVRILSIGSFVFLSVNTLGIGNSVYTASNPLIIANIIPSQFRPPYDLSVGALVINNGLPIAGVCLIDTSGSISWGLAGTYPLSYNGATGIAGAESVIASWSII